MTAQDDRKREAELREDRDRGAFQHPHSDTGTLLRLLDSERKRAETAETRCAGLEAALRGIVDRYPPAPMESLSPDARPVWEKALAALAASPAPSGGEKEAGNADS